MNNIEYLKFPINKVTKQTNKEEIPTGREIVNKINEIIMVVNRIKYIQDNK